MFGFRFRHRGDVHGDFDGLFCGACPALLRRCGGRERKIFALLPALQHEAQIAFLNAAVTDDDGADAETFEEHFERDRRRADEIHLLGRVLEDEAGAVRALQKALDELFVFLDVDGLFLRARHFGKIGIDVVEGGGRRADEDRRFKRPLFGKPRPVELLFQEFADGFDFLFIGINIGDELAREVGEPELHAEHLRLLRLGKVAYFDALAAQVDEDGALAGAIGEIGDIVAVGFGRLVDEVDRKPRRLAHESGDLAAVGDVTQRRGGDDVTALRALRGGERLHMIEQRREFNDAAAGEAVPLEIMDEAERRALAADDLVHAAVFGDDHGNAARTDVDDGIFHDLSPLTFCPRRRCRCRAHRRPRRPWDRRTCTCPRCRAGR